VSTWGEVFLGVIAFATLATALVQIGVLIAAARLARRLDTMTDHVEQQLKPIFAHLDTIGREASRAATLAGVQVERVDSLFAGVVQRMEETMDTLQTVVSGPAREGAALLAGFRAVVGSLRDVRRQGARSRGDDEDALFI
jgi:tetrahydromethanopterin S-methyltransferase subunit B